MTRSYVIEKKALRLIHATVDGIAGILNGLTDGTRAEVWQRFYEIRHAEAVAAMRAAECEWWNKKLAGARLK